MKLGDRIRKKREELGMSQTELAELVNTSKQTIYKYENNIITNIPVGKLEAIAGHLKTSAAALMGWEESEDIPIIESIKRDPDIRRIERARRNMPESEKAKMMNVLKATFDTYFSDDYEDDEDDLD